MKLLEDRTSVRGRARYGLLLGIMALAVSPAAAQWQIVSEGKTGARNAPALVWASELKQALLVGGETGEGVAPIMAFDPAAKTWKSITDKKPPLKRAEYFNIAGRVAYSAKHRQIFAYAWEMDTGNWGELLVFDLATGEWSVRPEEPLLADLAFCSVVCDEPRDRLLIVGSDKRPENLGYVRGVAIDLATGKASTLPLPADDIVALHQQQIQVHDNVTSLIGRTRLAWFRDPREMGTEAERTELLAAVDRLQQEPAAKPWVAQLGVYREAVAAKKLLTALLQIKKLQRQVELAMDEQYPVPRGRRDSPLAIVPSEEAAVLFGGDHFDYWMNDTWVLDLKTDAWRRANPKIAPAPQAGHAITSLPGTSQVAIYEGYTFGQLHTGQAVWLFDVKTGEWQLAAAQPWPKLNAPAEKPAAAPPPSGEYYGYSQQHYALPALAGISARKLLLEIRGVGGRPEQARPSVTWELDLDKRAVDEKLAAEMTARPNMRVYRDGPFVTDFTDLQLPESHKAPQLDAIPANRWTRLPDAPFNSMGDVRPRAWNSVVWDPIHEQILSWGGGHSVSPANSVVHYSPVSGRMVESYDSESPYQRYGMGYGPYTTSLRNRPWIPAHTYRLYCWDPTSNLMLFGYGQQMYFYDPVRMDWLKTTAKLPYNANYNYTLNVATPHGMVAWTNTFGDVGLWLVSAADGPDKLQVRRLEVQGKVPAALVDRDGLAYDSKRDRLLLHMPGDRDGSPGNLIEVSMKNGAMKTLTPPPSAIAKIVCGREVAYVAHADWLIWSEPFDRKFEENKSGSIYHIYDCAKDKWFLYDAGPGPPGMSVLHGMFYDAKRQLVFLMQQGGEVSALRIDPSTAKLRDTP